MKFYTRSEREEIVNALNLIKKVCEEQSDCFDSCPFETNGRCAISEFDNPSEWNVNIENSWKVLI